jgi:hypothetical protein
MDVYTVLFNTVMDNDIEALKKRVDSFPDFEVNAIVDGVMTPKYFINCQS